MKTGNLYFIIDDDPDDQELFIEALKGLDDCCQCVTAFNGHEALQKLTNGMPALPDFIFLDLNMPLMNGFKCLEAIKNIAAVSHIPVIIYSTTSEKKAIEDCIKAGAFSFLIKPASLPVLIQYLKDLIGQ